MISYFAALDILENEITPLAARDCGPDDLQDGVTIRPVLSPTAVPPFANSAMDGYAVRSEDTQTASEASPVELEVYGTAIAGNPPLARTPSRSAAEIMTGAALPEGCDAVIPVERVTQSSQAGANKIRISEFVQRGRNVRQAGEDFKAGQTVVDEGVLVEPHQLMGLAATGIRSAELRPMPRVAIIATGTELSSSGSAADLAPGMIEDANGPYLRAALARAGARIAHDLQVPDNPAEIETAISAAAENADLVITTGGVSAGSHDRVPSVIESLGGTILFHKVSVRPGKPVLAARLANGTLLIGLPGNPIAAAACLRFFAMPAIRMLRGLHREKLHAAVSTTRISKRSEFRFFGKAYASVSPQGIIQAELLPGQESFKIRPLTRANCWAIVKEGTDEISAGDLIEVAALYPDGFLQ